MSRMLDGGDPRAEVPALPRWSGMSDKEAQEVYAKAGLGESITLGSRPAVLVIDFSCGFTDPSGRSAPTVRRRSRQTRRALDAARAKGLPVDLHDDRLRAEPEGRRPLAPEGAGPRRPPDRRQVGRDRPAARAARRRDDRDEEGRVRVLRDEPRLDPGRAGRRLGGAVRGDDERLHPRDRGPPAPVRLALRSSRARRGPTAPRPRTRRTCSTSRRSTPTSSRSRTRWPTWRVSRGRSACGRGHRVALLPGDGVGPEVIAEARRAVDALGLSVEWTELPWGSAHWHEHGADDAGGRGRHPARPRCGADGRGRGPVRARPRLALGADPGGPPAARPVGEYQAGAPARGIPARSPAVGRRTSTCSSCARTPRASTPGRGRAHTGLDNEVGIETSVFTRSGVERVLGHAFELAAGRRGVLTSATKSNASRYGYVLWDEVADEVAADFPGVRYERVLVDALAARMVRDPESLDVVVASNLFGDILTDLAAAIQGGMGMAASANTAPGSDAPGLFEPVHGSAPDIAGAGDREPRRRRLERGADARAPRRAGSRGDADGRARGRVPRRPADARHRRRGDDSGGRGRDRGARSAHDPDDRAAGDDERAGDHEPVPIPSWCRPISTAAKTTAHSDWVAFSGATIDTRPWSNAASRKM